MSAHITGSTFEGRSGIAGAALLCTKKAET